MNKYCRAAVCVPLGVIKIAFTKLFHMKTFHASPICMLSPFSEISLDYGGELKIERGFKMRDGAKVRVRKSGKCEIGKKVSLNSGNVIACYEKITIGNDVQFGPNVLIYDHDHDFRTDGGLSAMKYVTAPVEIGNNVWIGANCVILRGSKIGDNCVVAAGTVVKGEYKANQIIYNQRETLTKEIQK